MRKAVFLFIELRTLFHVDNRTVDVTVYLLNLNTTHITHKHMSDAMTDIARDGRRGECFSEYLRAMVDFIKEPNATNEKAVLDAAECTDGVRGGYFSSSTRISSGLANELKQLQAGDRDAWARLLSSVARDPHDFKLRKEVSPFAQEVFIIVDYGRGFVSLHGDLQQILDSIISANNMRTYDCDTYAVTLPILPTEGTTVHWLGCGSSGPDIPTDRPRPAR